MTVLTQIQEVADKSHILLEGPMIGLIIANGALLIKAIYDHKKNGKAKPCADHEKRLAILETNEENQDKKFDLMRQENREDHQKIFDKLDDLG